MGGHFLFRRVYYHEWLPNTYYAKIGGHLWWPFGLRYVAAFTLEYGLWLWAPVLALGVLGHRARGSLWIPFLFGAILLPHALYVVAIGGDHFEYRPLDLDFPLLFLLAWEGSRHWARRRRAVPALAGYLLVALVALVELPLQSHRQFPRSYMSGFPGQAHAGERAAAEFLAPDRDPLYRLPGLRAIATTYRSLLGTLTAHFVAIRQEEHRLFLETSIAEGLRVRGMIERGLLPRDVRIAIDCVGAIPYLSGAWTLDRLGLTDARVAHSPFVRDVMAHGKQATIEYARARAVDLWPTDPLHLLQPLTSVQLIWRIDGIHDLVVRGESDDSLMGREPVYAADMGDGTLMLCELPRGPERTARRLPRLHFESIRDTVFYRRFLERCIAACGDSLRADSADYGMTYRLAFVLYKAERYREAAEKFEALLGQTPLNFDFHEKLFLCRRGSGDRVGALDELRRSIVLARRSGAREQANHFSRLLREMLGRS